MNARDRGKGVGRIKIGVTNRGERISHTKSQNDNKNTNDLTGWNGTTDFAGSAQRKNIKPWHGRRPGGGGRQSLRGVDGLILGGGHRTKH